MLEPVTATDQVDLAIAVDVGLGHALGRPDPGDRDGRPGRVLSGITRGRRQPQSFWILHPEGELIAAVAGKVAEDLVVVLLLARALDFSSDPGRVPGDKRDRGFPTSTTREPV